MSTKLEVREALKYRKELENNYRSIFSMLFHNSITIENLPNNLPKRYLLKQLLNRGSICYDRVTGLYLPYTYGELDQYGLPTKYQVYGYRGFNAWRDVEEVAVLRANDLSYPLKRYFEQQSKKIVEYDIAIAQNLEAIKTMSIMKVKDKKTLLTLDNFENARKLGALYAYIDSNLDMGETMKVASTGAQYLVNQLQQARQAVLNETFSSIGIATSNTDKRERVQGFEVTASLGVGKNFLQTLCDTFNYDAEVGGLPIRLKSNTGIEQTMENNNMGDITNA